MSTSRLAPSLCASLLLAAPLAAQTTAFTYQGFLEEGDIRFEGTISLRAELYNTPDEGDAVSEEIDVNDIVVENGLFSAVLDFGEDPFSESDLWLQLSIDEDGTAPGSDFEPLDQRVRILPVPFAIRAQQADSVPGDSDQSPTNELQNLAQVLDTGDNAMGRDLLNAGRIEADATGSGAFHPSQQNSALRVGNDGGLNQIPFSASHGNIAIGNYQLYTYHDPIGGGALSIQALVLQAQDDPESSGDYQMFAVKNSGAANMFSVAQTATGYGSQFHNSLAVGAEGDTRRSQFDSTAMVDFDIGSSSDLWVADDFEAKDTIYASNFVQLSSRDAKRDIRPLDESIGDPLALVRALKPVTFRYVDRGDGDLQVGLIAEDVQQVAPDFVHVSDTGRLGLQYTDFAIVSLEAIRQLEVEKDELAARVENLEARLARMEQALAGD